MKTPAPILIEPLEARIAPAAIANIDVSTLDGLTGFKLSGVNVGDLAGASVSGAGDVNGDGYDDVVVGAPNATGGATYSGAAYVVFGKAGGFAPNLDLNALDGNDGFKLGGVAMSDYTGFSVSRAGDVNGDGFDDLIVSAPRVGPTVPLQPRFHAGASYVVFGKASGFTASIALSALTGTDGFKISDANPTDGLGCAVSGAGDVNGDGFDDVIVGAYQAEPNGVFSGASFVIFGKGTAFDANLEVSTLDGSNGFKLSGVATDDRFGTSVSGAGDVNGDGFDDLIVGALYADPHGDGSGASYVVFGKATGFAANFNLTTLNGTNGFKVNGNGVFAKSGTSVSSAGDVNGDGFADLLVGSPSDRPTGHGPFRGAAYVIFGKAAAFTPKLNLSALTGANGFKLSGGGSNAATGLTVSGAGDVNGDGFDDVIVSALHIASPQVYSSTSYVVFGKVGGFVPNLNLTKLKSTDGFQINEPGQVTASFVVSGAGDVNGDGLADLIVGATNQTSAPSGAAYVVFGKAASNTYTFRDTDGDRVKIVASQGVIDPQGLAFTPSGMGRQLDLLTLDGAAFAGANLTIKAIPRVVNGITIGNGLVNIGEIDATGINLGAVKIVGDVTEFHAGDGTGNGVLTMQVDSLGKHSVQFPSLTPGLDVAGRLGQLTVIHDVTDTAITIGAGDAHGVGTVQINGNLIGSTLGVGAKIGRLTVAGSIIDSTVRAPGVLLPASTTAAVAIGTLSVNGGVMGSDILAGYDAAGNAVNGDAGIGTVMITGNFVGSNLVAGVADATLDGFGQNDTIIPGGNSILATIASLTILGKARGTAASGDFYGITAAFFGAAKIHGLTLQLTNVPTSYFPLDPVNNDLRLTVV